MADVPAAKRALSEVLGKKWDEYWTLLRRWFRRQITKQQLDNSVRALLHNHVSLHTAFMLSILRHCQGSTNGLSVAMASSARSTPSAPRPRSKSVKSVGASSAAGGTQTAVEHGSAAGQGVAAPPPTAKPSHSAPAAGAKKPSAASALRGKFVRYAPYPLLDFRKNVKRDSERLVKADEASWKPSRQPYLPSADGLMPRLEAHALSAGLESVDAEVPKLLLCAVENHIRNIICAASAQSLVTVPPELVDHDYALRPPLLAPDSRNGVRGDHRHPSPMQRHRPSSMLSGVEKSGVGRGRVPAATISQSDRSGGVSGSGGSSQDRRMPVPVGRITTMSVHNAVQANKSMFGGRSVSQPLIHRLQALL